MDLICSYVSRKLHAYITGTKAGPESGLFWKRMPLLAWTKNEEAWDSVFLQVHPTVCAADDNIHAVSTNHTFSTARICVMLRGKMYHLVALVPLTSSSHFHRRPNCPQPVYGVVFMTVKQLRTTLHYLLIKDNPTGFSVLMGCLLHKTSHIWEPRKNPKSPIESRS